MVWYSIARLLKGREERMKIESEIEFGGGTWDGASGECTADTGDLRVMRTGWDG